IWCFIHASNNDTGNVANAKQKLYHLIATKFSKYPRTPNQISSPGASQISLQTPAATIRNTELQNQNPPRPSNSSVKSPVTAAARSAGSTLESTNSATRFLSTSRLRERQ